MHTPFVLYHLILLSDNVSVAQSILVNIFPWIQSFKDCKIIEKLCRIWLYIRGAIWPEISFTLMALILILDGTYCASVKKNQFACKYIQIFRLLSI